MWELTKEDILKLYESNVCSYCGMTRNEQIALLDACAKSDKIKRVLGRKTIKTKDMTLDRADSLVGYTKDNVVLCCLFCNLGKGALLSARIYRTVCHEVIEELKSFLNPTTTR